MVKQQSDDQQPVRVKLSLTQLLGGAVAAMVGSLVASRLGVAGTILGAAVISVVATVVTAVNINSMNRVRTRARVARRMLAEARLAEVRRSRTSPATSPAPVTETSSVQSEDTQRILDEAETADLAELAAIDAQEATDAAQEGGPLDVADRRGLHWGAIAIVSALVFGLAMVGITVVEKITGQSIACSLGADCDRPTTIPFPGRTGRHTPSPTVTRTSPGAGSPTPSVTVTVTVSPTGSVPAEESPGPTDTREPTPQATSPTPVQSQPEASP